MERKPDKPDTTNRHLKEREQFSTHVFAHLLRQLDSVHARQDLAEWVSYHSSHEAAITLVWKRETLSASPAAVPQLLFIAGDVMLLNRTHAPALAASIGKILPRIIATILHKVQDTVQLQHLHRAVNDLVETMGSAAEIPKEWTSVIRQALNSSVERSRCGWVHEGLGVVDAVWAEASGCAEEATVRRGRFDAMYSKLYSREIDGTLDELAELSHLADEFLQQCADFEGKLGEIGSELRTRVVAWNDAEISSLEAEKATLLSRKRAIDEVEAATTQPRTKAPRLDSPTSPDEDFLDSDSEEDSRIILPGGK